jgi:hypothetical protein
MDKSIISRKVRLFYGFWLFSGLKRLAEKIPLFLLLIGSIAEIVTNKRSNGVSHTDFAQ